MFLLNTTMLREKFIISEKGGNDAMVAVGNRISLPLVAKSGKYEERFIVRAHNMHSTLRMAAMITKAFYRDGPILTRAPSYSWEPNWLINKTGFETDHNPQSWVAVYHGGKCIYKHGTYHHFMDIIEQCDARNRDEYDRAVTIAENAFNLAGRGVAIEHQSTIAMVIGAMADKSRLGLVFRRPRHSSTFNFSIDPKKQPVTKTAATAEPHQCLMQAAAWLELVQLSVTVGFYNAKRGKAHENAPPLIEIHHRLGQLNAEIMQFEESFDVRYRPEKPDMLALIEEATRFSKGEFKQPL